MREDKKYLVVKGVAGFGNRITTIADAISYAEKTNRILYVDWSDDFYSVEGENIFYDLFEYKDNKLITSSFENLDKRDVYPKLFQGEMLSKGVYELAHYEHVNNLFKIKIIRLIMKRFGFEKIWKKHNTELGLLDFLSSEKLFKYGKKIGENLGNRTIVYVDFLGRQPLSVFLNKFTLKKEYYLNGCRLKKGVRYYGLHLRGTDFKNRGFDICKVAKKIRIIIPDGYALYLATDDVEIRNQFTSVFGEELLTNELVLPELKSGGIHHFYRNKSAEEKRESIDALLGDIINLSIVDHFIQHKGSTLSNFIVENRRSNEVSPTIGSWQDLLITNN